MDTIRKIISGIATVLNLLLGTRLLWPARPNGIRAYLHRISMRIRNNPDLLIDFVYALRYPLALTTTLFAGGIAAYDIFFREGETVMLGVKLAGVAFVFGMGVLTVGAGRVAKRLSLFRRSAGVEEAVDSTSTTKLTPLRRLTRHAFILHLYLLVGAVLLIGLSLFGIGMNVFRATGLSGYEGAVLTFSILLLAQALITISQTVRRLRRKRVTLPNRTRSF